MQVNQLFLEKLDKKWAEHLSSGSDTPCVSKNPGSTFNRRPIFSATHQFQKEY